MWNSHLSRKMFLLAFVALGTVSASQAQQVDKRVEEIRKLYTEVNQQIAEHEKNSEESSIYMNEMVVNKSRGSWPAVGIYEVTMRFYYTFGDREIHPEPNRLLKVTTLTKRSSSTFYDEYLFDTSAKLIFHFQKDGENAETERRHYFTAERLIKSTVGTRNIDVTRREAIDDARGVLDLKKQLVAVFVNAR
jgi:hypothetical protein